MTIAFVDLLQALERYVRRFLAAHKTRRRSVASASEVVASKTTVFEPLRRVLLTDEVSRVLFGEFEKHHSSERGKEETGWALLGLRNSDEAIVLATLPAGTERDAGDTYVRFNPTAQVFASRIVRQSNKHLSLLGIVHTHPGSLRHPSDGDFRGDIDWVRNLRGEEGIFGIGTADAKNNPLGDIAWQSAPNVQCLGPFCLSWYSLRTGDRNYRPVHVDLTIGPDLAVALRPVWEELENHAERLNRLVKHIAGARFDVVPGKEKPALALTVPLVEPKRAIRVLMEGKEVRYLLLGPGEALAADFRDDRVDHGVFVMLAELSQ